MKLKVITALFAALLFAVPAAGAAEQILPAQKPSVQAPHPKTIKKEHPAAHAVKPEKKHHVAVKAKKPAHVHHTAKKSAKTAG